MSKKLKSAIGILTGTVFSRVLGFFREMSLGFVFGTSSFVDIYLVAMTIPGIFLEISTALFGTTFLPIFIRIREEKGEERANRFAGNLFYAVSIMSIIVIILGEVFPNTIVKILASGFSEDKLNRAVLFVRLLAPGIAMINLNALLCAYLQAKDKPNATIMTYMGYNVALISASFLAWIYPPGEIYILGGTVVGFGVQLAISMPQAIKAGFSLKFKPADKESFIRMGMMLGPVLLSVSFQQISSIVDRALGSHLGTGSIAALNYANKLQGFMYGILTVTISLVLYPVLAKLAAKSDMKGFKVTIRKTMGILLSMVVPLSILVMVLSEPIVKVLFERGAFDQNSTNLTKSALFFYSIGIVGFGLRDLLTRIFYSLEDSKTPMINGIIGIVCSIGLNLILAPKMGVSGIALGSSLGALISAALLLFSLRNKIGSFGFKTNIISILKIFISIVPMLFVAIVLNDFFAKLGIWNSGSLKKEFFALLLSGTLSFASYILAGWVLKMDEMRYLGNQILNIVKKKGE